MNRTRYRGSRVFHVDEPRGSRGGWYVEVRDGAPRGPYATRGLAERALAEYTGGSPESSPARREDDEGAPPKD